jgi:hypothetical protein
LAFTNQYDEEEEEEDDNDDEIMIGACHDSDRTTRGSHIISNAIAKAILLDQSPTRLDDGGSKSFNWQLLLA